MCIFTCGYSEGLFVCVIKTTAIITSAFIPRCTLISTCLCADKERCPREVCVYKRERAGVLMVECDGCNQWYHSKCVHLTKKEAKTCTNWFCQQCLKN